MRQRILRQILKVREIEIGFNAKYIMDMLENLKENEILISFMDNSSPIIAQEKSNPDLIYVLKLKVAR